MAKTEKKNRVKDALFRRSSFIIILILILGAIGLLRIVMTHRQVEDVASIDLPLIEILTKIETAQLEQTINFEKALRYGKEIQEDNQSFFDDFTKADSTFRYLTNEVDLKLGEAESKIESALASRADEQQKVKLRGLLNSVKKLKKDHKNYEQAAYKVMKIVENGQYNEAMGMINTIELNDNNFNAQVEGVLMRYEMFTESITQMIEQKEVMSMRWIVSVTLMFIVFSLIAVYILSYRIWRPLEDIRLGSERLGDGHLDTRIQPRSSTITGEIITSFNSMAHQMEQSQTEINKFINFSYSTANDLKIPVENLHSLFEVLENDKLGEASFKSTLSNAKKTISKLENTINDLTEVNRIRENLRIEDKVPVLLDDILKETLFQIKDQIPPNVSFKRDFSEIPSVVYGKESLRSIFKILIVNSITYSHPKRSLEIRIKSQEKNGQTAIIFKDNGLGFDYIKHQYNIFNPFVRLHRNSEGSGLGLYIVKMIADFNKDQVKVHSEIGKGANFTLFIKS